MHRVGLGIFLFVLSCGILHAEMDKRFMVGVHYGFLIPSLGRIEESEALDNWRYDVGWGVDLNINVIPTISVSVLYDMYPIRYHGLADRSDVSRGDISGRYGFIHHGSGEILYNYIQFNHSHLFLGGSVDYFYADQTVNGSYYEDGEEIFYTNEAKIDKVTFGIPLGIASYLGTKLGFSLRIKPVFYWWSDESKIQFITMTSAVSFGFAF